MVQAGLGLHTPLQDGKAQVQFFTCVIALGSFSQIITGSVDTFHLAVLHLSTFGQYLIQFLLPTLTVTSSEALPW
jgi:hypothetical protein